MATKKKSKKAKAAKKKRSPRKRATKASALKITDDYLSKYCTIVQDQIDPRDHRFMAMDVGFAGAGLPKSVDHAKETAPVGNQLNTGSCVGWATTYGLRRWLHKKSTGKKHDFSVRFVWMTTKEIDQWVPNVCFDGSGTSIRDAFKVMNKYGCCSDSLWPFSKSLPDDINGAEVKKDAQRYRIGAYHGLSSNDERRAHLAKQGPFVVGVPVFSNWSSIGTDGIVPSPGGSMRGGHAILVVGYDDSRKQFKFQNSWSTSWGDKGYGYFTYDYMESHSWNSWGADQL